MCFIWLSLFLSSVLPKDQYKISLDIVQPIWDGGKIEAEKENIKAQSKSEESSIFWLNKPVIYICAC